ncbi:MAG: helix-turn-helix domain-containing protein [Daejeonella sp.]
MEENPFNTILQEISQLKDLILTIQGTHPINQPINTEAPVSQKEICEFLGITQPTLIKMRNRREIPFKRAGARYLYNKADVSAAIEKKGGYRK